MTVLRVFLNALGGCARRARAWVIGCAVAAAALAVGIAGRPPYGWLALSAGGGAGRPETALGGLLAAPLLALCAVDLGSCLFTNDQGGLLGLLLAYPLRRGWLALAHLTALATWLAGAAAAYGLFLWTGFAAAGAPLLDAGRLAGQLGLAGLAALGFGGLALAVGARGGGRGQARLVGLGGLALAVALGFGAALLPGWLSWVGQLSPLTWVSAGWVLPLLGWTALAGALAAAGMERREG